MHDLKGKKEKKKKRGVLVCVGRRVTGESVGNFRHCCSVSTVSLFSLKIVIGFNVLDLSAEQGHLRTKFKTLRREGSVGERGGVCL